MQNYRTHNPRIQILGFRKGDIQLEKYYHNIFKNRRIDKEWFLIPDSIIFYLVKHHFIIKDECVTDKPKKKIIRQEKIPVPVPEWKLLLNSLYNKIVITRITQDINDLQFTPEEERLLIKYKLYDPERLRRGI